MWLSSYKFSNVFMFDAASMNCFCCWCCCCCFVVAVAVVVFCFFVLFCFCRGGGGVLGPFSPKYGPIFLKFWPEVISDKAKQRHFMNNLLKFCWSRNKTYPKFTVLVHFWLSQIIPWKRKILLKVKTFQKTTSSGISKHKSQVPEFPANCVSLFFVITHSSSENFQQKH